MDLASKKIALLLSDRHPLWQNLNVPDFKNKCDALGMDKAVLYRWLRSGVPTQLTNHNLITFCDNFNVLCKGNGIDTSVTPENILAFHAGNYEMAMELFSRHTGMTQIMADQALSEFLINHSLVLPVVDFLPDIGNKQNNHNNHSKGIYFLDRMDDRKIVSLRGVLVIADNLTYKISKKHRREFVYAKAFIPNELQPITNPHRPFEYYAYEGWLASNGGVKYFSFRRCNYLDTDMVFMIIDMDIHAYHENDFSGKYLSINIDGLAGIQSRDIKIHKVSNYITDENITKCLNACSPNLETFPVDLADIANFDYPKT